ncbi:hypothetical protein J6590_075651 [Homalodisca vitripennis]|nr:hypothetical protein J6590_075651 [Homalodisca vitripennis]
MCKCTKPQGASHCVAAAGDIQCDNCVSLATAQTWLQQNSLIGHRLDSIQVVQEVTRKVLNSILATDLKRTFDEWQTH